MKNTHTEIIFCIKDEPILSMIRNEFAGFDYTINMTEQGRFIAVQLNINKIIPFDKDDSILMEGYKTQFESLTYYTKH